MTAATGNILSFLPGHAAQEDITTLLATSNVRIESIVSHGHASPEGFWYDQDWAEWVIVVKGSAELLFEDESAPRMLRPGDYVAIAPHARHRVTATDPHEPTVWLAVHHRA
jgi:cupin 2 domain-containing protein